MRSIPSPNQWDKWKNADTESEPDILIGESTHNGRGGNGTRDDPRKADRAMRNRSNSPGEAGPRSRGGAGIIPLLTSTRVRSLR